MAAEFEHHPARISDQFATTRLIEHLAHHRVDLEDFAQPTLCDRLPEHDDGRVVAVHVAHLDDELPFRGGIEDPSVLR